MRSFSVVQGEAALAQQFDALRADAVGAGSLLSHQQLGAVALPTNPTNGQTLTLTINGSAIVITFVSAIGSAAGNVLIAGTAAGTAANLIALLNQPQTTTATGVALSAANQALVGYLSWPLSGTTITPSSNNTALYAPQSSFTASTTVTGGSYTAQTLQLYVEPGVVYVGGTRVIYAGGSSPTVTAPSTNPRIDVLAIDNAGTLSWTTGSENASPTAPAYPAGKVALCELYNVVGETALYDNGNQHTSQGYVLNDVRPIIGSTINLAALPNTIIPDGDGTRDLGSSGTRWNNGYFKTAVFVNGAATAVSKSGGTGADGALTITSGTTTLSTGGVALFEKNYTSISITGTGVLAFSGNVAATGTTVVLRSQAGGTVTSTAARGIDMRSLGGGPGNGFDFDNVSGSLGGGGGAGSGAGAGLAGGSFNNNGAGLSLGGRGGRQVPLIPMARFVAPGGNGGSGGVGTGGLGGGGLYIECAGAYNFGASSTIDLSGANGTNGVSGTSGGSGAGAGGNLLVLYGSLTADAGTYTVTGGTGGTAGGSNSQAGGNAANGLALRSINNYVA